MKFTRKSKLLLCIILTVFSAIQLCVGATFAWFKSGDNQIEHHISEGSYIQQYFDSGTGTEQDPFVITRPIHFYHLVELYQRDSNFAKGKNNDYHPYHFQIGRKFKDATDKNAYYVYNYDDFGTPSEKGAIDGKYSDKLNMKYYSGSLSLLPIGTSETPFMGELNGNGLVVENLNITASEKIGTKYDFKTADVGIFGYIDGSYINNEYQGGYVHDVFFDGVTIDISNLDYTADENEGFNHPDHQNAEVYVGYVAGHLPVLEFTNGIANTTGILENVYVNDCKIVGYSSSEKAFNGTPYSAFGFIGHVDVLTSGSAPVISSLISGIQGQKPTGGGGSEEGSGWGGSIEMNNLFTRVAEIYDNNSSSATYYSQEDYFVNNADGISYNKLTSSTVSYSRYYSNETAGAYIFKTRSGGGNYVFVGGRDALTDTINTYTIDYVEGFTVSNGANYMGLNGNNTTVTNASGAQVFVMDDQGHIYTRTNPFTSNGNMDLDKHYLNASGENLAYSTNQNNATVWQFSDDTLSTVISGKTYYLDYLNYGGYTTFGLVSDDMKVFAVKDKNANNYLMLTDFTYSTISLTSRATVSNATSLENATSFVFDNGKVYTYAVVGNTKHTYYLNGSGSGLGGSISIGINANNATTWSYDSSTGDLTMEDGGLKYALSYANGWSLYLISPLYKIYSGNDYLKVGTDNSLSSTNEEDATLFAFYSGRLQVAKSSGSAQYLRITSSGTGSRKTFTFSASGTSNNNWSLNNGLFSNEVGGIIGIGASTRYISFSGGSWTTTDDTSNSANSSVSHRDTTSVFIDNTNNAFLRSTKTSSNLKDIVKTESYVKEGGTSSCFPLSIDVESGIYSASDVNTGYIIGGSYDTSNYDADIRISKYSTTKLSNSTGSTSEVNFSTTDYNSGLEIITRTYKSDGKWARITDLYNNTSHPNINNFNNNVKNITAKTVKDLGLLGYEDVDYDGKEGSERKLYARDKFKDILTASANYVYGLHFVNSLITIDHKITANKAYILGKTYENYEFPEDCIDFVVERTGRISFFAGTYTNDGSTVNTFFSLHEIKRDNGVITEIKEISKIYYNADISKKYVYIYKDAEGNDYGTLPSGYSDGDLVFDLSWITNPSSLIQNAIYYFEIPCNAGEYALGSVENGYGAYLIYLDIGANGAGGSETEDADSNVPATVIGSGNAFSGIDYRSKEQTIELKDGKHLSVIEIAYDIPANSTSENFDIRVEYKEADELKAKGRKDIGSWCKGVYQIYVKNKTGNDINLDVLLCDNGERTEMEVMEAGQTVMHEEFPYAYEIYVFDNAENGYVAIANDETDYVNGYNGALRRWSKSYRVTSIDIVDKNS